MKSVTNRGAGRQLSWTTRSSRRRRAAGFSEACAVPANTLDPTIALTKEHPEYREQADREGYGGDRGPQDVSFSA